MRHSAHVQVMIQAARKAARGLVRDFGEVEQLQVSMKGPADFVSAADHRAEAIIRRELQRARPDYGLLLEEAGEIAGAFPEHRFLVDPLDGTTNFLHGLPHFAISLALEQHGEITAAVILDPLRDELFVADRGNGAFMNDRRLRVSARTDLRTAVIGTGIPSRAELEIRLPEHHRQLARVTPAVVSIRCTGCTALDLAYVAAGRLDGYWRHGLKPWDIAAGILIVREAGGLVGRLEGPALLEEGTLMAATPHIAPRLERLLREAA